MKLNSNIVVFTGGGTGGHIYPGLAVADELKRIGKTHNNQLFVYWIGCSTGMDKKIVDTAIGTDGSKIVNIFYGIPSGKLRRYFSLKNFTDIFRIIKGYFKAKRFLRKVKPALLFSKGGFVSVPPVLAAKRLKIPVYTHECDFTLGLANKINFKFADKMFVSYEETKQAISKDKQSSVIVTGNPVRPAFYYVNREDGFNFLQLPKKHKKVLLVLGGSSGAKQINNLVFENIQWLCDLFIVVHQTGLVTQNEETTKLIAELKKKYSQNYKPYDFIYEQMPNVIACADFILSRAGANTIWEAAVLTKPSLLIPLCGNGTRGDQVDNAKFFKEKNASLVLIGDEVNSENLKKELLKLKTNSVAKKMRENIRNMVGTERSVNKIANIIYEQL